MGYQFGQAAENYIAIEINGESYPLKLGSHLLQCFEDAQDVINSITGLGSIQDLKQAEDDLVGILEDVFGVESMEKIMGSTVRDPQLEDLIGLFLYIKKEFVRYGEKAKEAAPANNRQERRSAERKTRRPSKDAGIKVVE